MKQKVCMVGPFPPPMNGNSKAFDTIIQSDICHRLFDFEKIDLYALYSGKNGKASISKLKGVFSLNSAIRKVRKKEDIDTYYISCAQTAVGSIRDAVIIRQILKQKKACKTVMHLHGGGFKTFYERANPLIRKMVRWYYAQVDQVIVLGESLRAQYDGIVPTGKLVTVPNCVDDDMVISEAEYEEKIKEIKRSDRIKVLYLSNMIESKGYKDVLKAALKLHGVNTNIVFTFAGAFRADRDRIEFERFVADNKLYDTVNYVGIVQGEQKRKLLLESYIFVLPTYYPNEGQPISIIECMSAGMAILSTDHAGICDLLKPEYNGRFIEAKNSDSICENILKLTDRNEIIKFSGKSRAFAKSDFTEEKYISRICEILYRQ